MTLFPTAFSARRFASVSTAFFVVAFFAFFAFPWSVRLASAADSDVLSPIAPFLNSKTVGVARLNLDGIDFDRLGETIDSVFAQLLTNAGVSDEAVAASQKEFAKTLDALKKAGRDALAESRKTNGLREAFFIVQNANGDGLAVVVPTAELTSEQTNVVKTLFESNGWNSAVYKKKFLVASPLSLKTFGAYYKTFVPGRDVDRDAFFAENRDKLAVLYCAPFRIRAALDAATGGVAKAILAAQPQSYRAALEAFDSSIGDIKVVVDAGALSARVVFRFTSAVASGQMREKLEKLIDAYIDEQFEQMLQGVGASATSGAQTELVERFNVVPLLREFQRGTLRARLPRQEGARLIFDYNIVDEAKKNGSSFASVGIVAAFLTPAIQTARRQALRQNGEIDFESDVPATGLDAPEPDDSDPNGSK